MNVSFNRAICNHQLLCNLAVCATFGQLDKNFQLPSGESLSFKSLSIHLSHESAKSVDEHSGDLWGKKRVAIAYITENCSQVLCRNIFEDVSCSPRLNA